MNLVNRLPTARMLASLLLVAGLSMLAGCATSPGGATSDAGGQWHTASDDTEERKRARTRLALAVGYYENGQLTIALDEQKKAAQADPNFSDVYNVGGMIYMALGDTPLAQTQFQRAIALNPRDGSAMHNLGWLYCENGQFESANVQFEKALAVPNYMDRARTLMAQGVCQARAGQMELAEATLMRSYELDAGNPVTGYNLALLLYRRAELDRARFYIRRLNNSDLANAESLWLGIRIEHRLGDQRTVEQLASQLRRRFPQSSQLVAYERGQFDD